MEYSKSSALLCLALFLVFSSASAFDIIKILEKQSDLSNFVTYLKETKLGAQINKRSTITVLAVSNGGIASLAEKTQEEVKNILSVHVVLDYYDSQKLNKLTSKKPVTLATMFQSSGLAQNQQGFVNIGKNSDGEIAFGSASKGAKLNAKFVKSIVSQPFNLSVVQVSDVIEIPDMSSSASSPAGSPKSSPASSDDEAPAPSPKSSKSKAKSPSSDDEEEAPPPVSDEAASPPEPEEVSSPPVSGDVSAPSDAVITAADTPAEAPSAATRSQMAVGGGVATMIGLASLLVA